MPADPSRSRGRWSGPFSGLPRRWDRWDATCAAIGQFAGRSNGKHVRSEPVTLIHRRFGAERYARADRVSHFFASYSYAIGTHVSKATRRSTTRARCAARRQDAHSLGLRENGQERTRSRWLGERTWCRIPARFRTPLFEHGRGTMRGTPRHPGVLIRATRGISSSSS